LWFHATSERFEGERTAMKEIVPVKLSAFSEQTRFVLGSASQPTIPTWLFEFLGHAILIVAVTQ
jgi:hypothetical protein